MSEIWYELNGLNQIRQVDVTKTTKKQIWLNGRQRAKDSRWASYHRNKDAAVARGIINIKASISSAQAKVRYYESELKEFIDEYGE